MQKIQLLDCSLYELVISASDLVLTKKGSFWLIISFNFGQQLEIEILKGGHFFQPLLSVSF